MSYETRLQLTLDTAIWAGEFTFMVTQRLLAYATRLIILISWAS